MSLKELREGVALLRAKRRAGEPVDRAAFKAAMIPFVDALPWIVREPLRGAWQFVLPRDPDANPPPRGPTRPTPRVQPATTAPTSAPVPVVAPPSPARAATPRPAAAPSDAPPTYEERIARETEIFADQVNVHALPEIFHYWSNRYLLPILQQFGCAHPEDFLALHLFESARRTGAARPRFVSLGCGNCDAEVRIAQDLVRRGLTDFSFECMDINPAMLERGAALAREAGLDGRVVPVRGDFNRWTAQGRYDGIMANQSLHHVLELEALFDATRAALAPQAGFVISDMIGRNGHQRWPEAAAIVREFWRELPPDYRYNLQLQREEQEFLDWDCAVEGFEGVRAQDILPLLLQRFHVDTFIGFGNIIDPFIDRGFGHHFDETHAFDRYFIDRVHARDEAEMLAGTITPTHMLAVMRNEAVDAPRQREGLAAAHCVRATDRV